MADYMLIFRDDASGPLRPDVRATMFQEFIDWAEALAAGGHYIDSGALRPNTEGRTLRRRGETLALDGPFAESQEAVNGFIAVRAASMEEAARLAEGCPSLRIGWAVEIRELQPIPKPARRAPPSAP